MKYTLIALVLFLTSCSMHVSPLPGVGIHIPVHHDSGHRDSRSDSKSNDDKYDHD